MALAQSSVGVYTAHTVGSQALSCRQARQPVHAFCSRPVKVMSRSSIFFLRGCEGRTRYFEASSGRRLPTVCKAAGSGKEDVVPAGCSRYKVELSKPLGLVLAEDKWGNIIVDSVAPGGNADKDGTIQAGDQLIATSAIVFTRENTYGIVNVRSGEQVIRLLCLGESFKTVMAAIGTHPANKKVTLEFQKCDPNRPA